MSITKNLVQSKESKESKIGTKLTNNKDLSLKILIKQKEFMKDKKSKNKSSTLNTFETTLNSFCKIVIKILITFKF